MLFSISLILLLGLLAGQVTSRLGLPALVAYLLLGMILGPHGLHLLDENLLALSGDLRRIALVVILLKAGLTLSFSDFRSVGRQALLLSFLPASFEILGYGLLAPLFFPVSHTEALLLGAVIAAVSPAVVVPRMARFIEEGLGTAKKIPQLVLAGASCDDIFVIVLFTSLLHILKGGAFHGQDLLSIPGSILSGILVGGLVGLLLAKVLGRLSSSLHFFLLFGTGLLLLGVEDLISELVPLSGLLAIMASSMVLRQKTPSSIHGPLSQQFGRLWIGAEVFLFVLVGAAVDLPYTLHAGAGALLLILLCLLFRSLGVLLSTSGLPVTRRERLFFIVAYLPKATVQAAIGGIALSEGLSCGVLVLSVAVVSILFTAPLGSLLIDVFGPPLLASAHKKSHA